MEKMIIQLKTGPHELTDEELQGIKEGTLRWIDGELLKVNSKKYKTAINNKQKRDEINSQIAVLRKNLADTDYKAIKYAEGLITEEDYAEIKAQRQAWRDRINELEAELNN